MRKTRQKKKKHLIKPISSGFYWAILGFIVDSKLLANYLQAIFDVEI